MRESQWSKTQFKKLNQTLLENLNSSLIDMKSNVGARGFHRRLSYECYLLAMLRAVLDFTDVAYAQNDRKLGGLLDSMFQDVQSMVVKRSNQRFPWLHLNNPVQKRINIGVLYQDIRKIRRYVKPQPKSAKKKQKK